MITEDEIARRWKKERPVYKAWGEVGLHFIKGKLSGMLSVAVDEFAEIIQCRLKSEASLVDKALHRGKNYKSPYDDITDKVGLRFVVHLEEDVAHIREAIKLGGDIWHWKQVKNFADDRQVDPLQFDYESDHYLVINKEQRCSDHQMIPAGIVCEIQVRTMLQHSLNVLAHNYVYKQGYTPVNVQRCLAKCRALAASVNDAYTAVMRDMKNLNDPKQQAYAELEQFYRERIDSHISAEKSGMHMLDGFNPEDFNNMKERLGDLMKKHPYVSNRIKERREKYRLFRHPAILFAYLMVSADAFPRDIFSPKISEAPLKLVYADLGESYDGGEY